MATVTKAKKKATARKQQRQKDRHKRPDLTKLYRRKLQPFDLATQDFRATLIRDDVPRARLVNIDGLIETLEWRYEPGNPVLLGTMTTRRDVLSGGGLRIHDGHVLRLQVRWGGKWRELWRMRLRDSQPSLRDQTTWGLADDLALLQESDDWFHYTKSKKGGHPKGWLVHEIVRDVCRRYRIPVGKIAKGTHYITDLSGKMTPLQVLQKAYAIEKQANGHRFTIAWRNGKLNVTPLRRNDVMYVLRDAIEDAVVGKTARDAKFATAVTVRATLKGKKGSHKKSQIEVRHVNEKAVRADGFIHKVISGGTVKDRADADRKAKRYIATHSVRKPVITNIQHRGIAFLRRGDAIWISLPQFGFSGARAVCFLASGTWQLASGEFTMSLDVAMDDPFAHPKTRRKAKDKQTRTKKRKDKKK